MNLSRRMLTSALAVVLVCGTIGLADTWPPVAGQTGSITINCPNAQDGAEASLWGFYSASAGWVSYTFGVGTFTSGSAVVNYTVPANFVSNFYWNAVARYSTTSDEKAQYEDTAGGWDQFFTSNPNGQTVNVSVYQFDQRSVTTSTASFRASAQNGTVFPPASLTEGWVTVRQPWTGTMAQFTAPTGGYYTYAKTSLLPTRLASRGFLVDVLEGNPAATQEFQKIRLHNADNSYSVELFGFKNVTSDDPAGYLWWVTLVDVASADCTYNGATGVFSGTFPSPLATGIMYFVVPEFIVLDSVGSTKDCWIQAGRGTDLLLSGASFVANKLALDATPASLYVRFGEPVVVDMNVSNLQQMVNGCQALLGYNSSFFPAAGTVAAGGGGVWTELIYEVWRAAAGEVDTAVGIKLDGPTGTQADGKVAIITLTAGTTEGTTRVIFRPDDGSGYSTMLSDLNANPVWPVKFNSLDIVIDNTPPVITAPADYATTVATQTITASAVDALAGMASFTMNGLPFSGSATVVLVPGANTFTFVATDKAGNVATHVLTITYTQPAPAVAVYRSLAPNKYGSPSWAGWLNNAVAGARAGGTAQGSGYERFEPITGAQDYAAAIVTGFNSWKGLVTTDPELGTAIHFVWRLDNGVESNPGAAKLDARNIQISLHDFWLNADAAGSTDTDYSSWWNATASGAQFGGTTGFNSALKGYDWNGSAWVEVTSGTQADLIIYGWLRYAQAAYSSPPASNQDALNEIYKQMAGSLAFLPDPRQTLDRQELQVTYTAPSVSSGSSGVVVQAYQTVDATLPVITLVSPTPAEGAKLNVAGQTIAGTATDNETLASGIREVTITLNSVQVFIDRSQDNVSFSQAVTLAEGDNTIVVTATDFAGKVATQTLHLILDTQAPTVNIDSASQGGPELLISLGSTTNAVQGNVTITVSASDAGNSGLITPPAVKVTDAAAVETVLTASGSGPWTYVYAVTSTTANGIATITANVADGAGNTAVDTDTFAINKNQVTGTVSFATLRSGAIVTPPSPAAYTFNRVVTRGATDAGGAVLKSWTPSLGFTNDPGTMMASASFTLTDVPAATDKVSAKTAWQLRKRLMAGLDGNGQSVLAFTLLGGDVRQDNFVNILDYSIVKGNWNTANAAADVNGDGQVQLLDYNLMQSNWFKPGDPE